MAVRRNVAIRQIHDERELTCGLKNIERIIHEIKILKNQGRKIKTNPLIRTEQTE